MKKKRILAILLVLAAVVTLSACTKSDGSYEAHTEKVLHMEQTDLDSPIYGVRTGIKRSGIVWGNKQFECTDDGVYYLSHVPCKRELEGVLVDSYSSFLFFCQHGSDNMIKLCGRPDCTHDTVECNACFDSVVGGVSYYNGYLYVVTEAIAGRYIYELYRLNLDGSGRVKVKEFADMQATYSNSHMTIVDGVLRYNLGQVDPKTGQEVVTWYYYKLDGSMKKPKVTENLTNHFVEDEAITIRGIDDNGNYGEFVYGYDLHNDTSTFLFDKTDYGWGFWGREAGYYLDGSKVMKVTYHDGKSTVLFDTGLEGTYSVRFFPDCILLIENLPTAETRQKHPMLYFYDWEGNYQGEVALGFPCDRLPSMGALIGGETKDRILLYTTGDGSNTLPEYYIEKSDFGTGPIRLHRFQFPDLDSDTIKELFTCWEPAE